jgi:hypothetical protein
MRAVSVMLISAGDIIEPAIESAGQNFSGLYLDTKKGVENVGVTRRA